MGKRSAHAPSAGKQQGRGWNPGPSDPQHLLCGFQTQAGAPVHPALGGTLAEGARRGRSSRAAPSYPERTRGVLWPERGRPGAWWRTQGPGFPGPLGGCPPTSVRNAQRGRSVRSSPGWELRPGPREPVRSVLVCQSPRMTARLTYRGTWRYMQIQGYPWSIQKPAPVIERLGSLTSTGQAGPGVQGRSPSGRARPLGRRLPWAPQCRGRGALGTGWG